MQQQESSAAWMEKEIAVFFWAFRVFCGGLLLWLALGMLVNWVPLWPGPILAFITISCLWLFPVAAYFASLVLTGWGILLIVLGWRHGSEVLTLSIATFVSALPITLLAVGYVYFQSF